MAEIKSAIELAMERTANLVMDDEEKQESRKKELENRLKAIMRRYLEGMVELDGAMDEIDGIKADAALKRGLLMDLLLEELDITKENARMLALFKRMGSLPGSLMAEFDALRQEFTRQLEKKESVVREQVRARLAAMGVGGDGLEPNVEAWEEWAEARDATGRIFREQTEKWKERLARELHKG
jgi:hypothetical protein